MVTQGKWIVYAAIVGLFAMMGGFVYYASLDVPRLERATIELVDVELLDVNSIESRAKLKVTYLIANPSDKTFTIPLIRYNLKIDGVELGSGAYSTGDIAMPGRAAFFPGAAIELDNIFNLVYSDRISDQYNAIVSGQNLNYEAEGVMEVESAWSVIEKDFVTKLN